MSVKELTYRKFIEKLAYKTGISEKTVEKVYDNLFLILSEELRFVGTINLRDIGRFYTVERGGKDKMMPSPDGSYTPRYIEPFYAIKFKPAANLKNFTNGRIVDKESKKAIKRKGKLSKRDLQLLNYKSEDRERNLEIALSKLEGNGKEILEHGK